MAKLCFIGIAFGTFTQIRRVCKSSLTQDTPSITALQHAGSTLE